MTEHSAEESTQVSLEGEVVESSSGKSSGRPEDGRGDVGGATEAFDCEETVCQGCGISITAFYDGRSHCIGCTRLLIQRDMTSKDLNVKNPYLLEVSNEPDELSETGWELSMG